MEFSHLLAARRSYRRFKATPVPREAVHELMEAAHKAPVSCNLQLTQYVVIDDQAILKTLRERVSYKFGYAPVCIVVLYDPRFTIEHQSAVMTAGMAVENILLRATELGLATCPMAGFKKDEFIKQTLGIPEELELLLLVAVGHPEGSVPRPVTKLEPEALVGFNSYAGLERTLLNGSQRLADWTPTEVAEYRSRIAPVYLERFRLRVYDEDYYQAAAERFREEVSTNGAKRVLDLMSYDGTFLRLLKERCPTLSLTASDYVANNRAFLEETLGIPSVRIDAENALHTDAHYDALSFVFQAAFTPKVEALLESAEEYLEPGGRAFVALVEDSWYRRLLQQLRLVRRRMTGQPVNVYEGNPFYRTGPYAHVSVVEFKELMGRLKFQFVRECTPEQGRARGRRARYLIFEKPKSEAGVA